VAKERERIIIDVIQTEDGYEIYQVIQYSGIGRDKRWMPKACRTSGFFYYSDELDEWLDANAKEVELMEDFRV